MDLRQLLPVTARAAVVTLTATDPTAAGFVTVFTHGATRPNVSSLNKRAGETRSNTVTVALAADGSRSVDVFNQAGRTDVVIDVSGYYDPTALTGDFYPAFTPIRVLDDRPDGRLQDGGGYQVDVPRPRRTARARSP